MEIEKILVKQKNPILIESKMFNENQTLLGLVKCPYLGIYSNQYDFFFPFCVLKMKNFLSNKFITNNLKKQILQECYNGIENEYMIIDVDISNSFSQNFSTENSLDQKRLNLVIHSYLYYNIDKLTKDHTSKVYNALFSINNEKFYDYAYDNTSFYINEINNEEEYIRINPKILDKETIVQVILHESNGDAAISPNNNSFLLNLNLEGISFHYLTHIIYHGKPVRTLLARFNLTNKYFPYSNYQQNTNNFMIQILGNNEFEGKNEYVKIYLNSIFEVYIKYCCLLNMVINTLYSFFGNLSKNKNVNLEDKYYKNNNKTGFRFKELIFELYFRLVNLFEYSMNYDYTINQDFLVEQHYDFKNEEEKRFYKFVETKKLKFKDFIKSYFSYEGKEDGNIDNICFEELKKKGDNKLLIDQDEFNGFFIIFIKFLQTEISIFSSIIYSKIEFYQKDISNYMKVEDFINVNKEEIFKFMKESDFYIRENMTKYCDTIFNKSSKQYNYEDNTSSNININEIGNSIDTIKNESSHNFTTFIKENLETKNGLMDLDNIFFIKPTINHSNKDNNSNESNPLKINNKQLKSNIFSNLIVDFENIMNSVFISDDNLQVEIMNLNDIFANLLFFRTWVSKGKCIGVHSEFGKHSFLRSKIIPQYYHCNTEEIANIILSITSDLSKLINI